MIERQASSTPWGSDDSCLTNALVVHDPIARGVEFVDAMAVAPGSDRPTLQARAVPWRPLGLGPLLGVLDRASQLGIDQHDIGIIPDLDPTFSHDPPDPRRSIGRPGGDLIPSAFAPRRAIEQERKVVLNGRQTAW